jgi:xylulokinase
MVKIGDPGMISSGIWDSAGSKGAAAMAQGAASAPDGVALCVDLGASSMRVAVFARDGEALAAASAPLQLGTEADAEAWFGGLEALAGEALAAAGRPRVASVAIAAFTRSEVHLDASGAVLRPAMTFRDARAVEEAARIDARLGGQGEVTAFSPLARLDWIRRHEPAVFARMALVLQPKDFLNFRLTGVAAADPASNAPLVGATRGYLAARFAAAGIDPGLFAPLRAPSDMLGHVRPGLPGALAALAGARVAVGAMDTWAATLGLGVHHAGAAYNLSGTTEVNGLILSRAAEAPGLLCVAWDEGLFHLGGPSQAGGACLDWFARLSGASVAGIAAEAATSDPAGDVPVFLPYPDGERVPFWNPALRAGFLDLGRGTTRGAMARAVMEGVAFHDRVVLERGFAACGARPDGVVAAGGGASDLWCQVKADAWGIALRRPALAEPGLRGALLLAGGAPPAPRDDLFLPRPALRAAMDARHARFLAALPGAGAR